MKFLPLLILTFLSLASSPVSDHSRYPVPPTSSRTLFYIQRSNNANTVIYEANLHNNTFNPKEPVQVYWIRYAEQGQKRALNFIERTVAYGVKCSPAGSEEFVMNFVASKARQAHIFLDGAGRASALMNIGNKQSRLNKIFVQVAEDGWWPKIDYLEFFGTDTLTNEPTYEKMKV
jgi:hypothetical protein